MGYAISRELNQNQHRNRVWAITMVLKPESKAWVNIVEWTQSVPFNDFEWIPLSDTVSVCRFDKYRVVFNITLKPYLLDQPISVRFCVQSDGVVNFTPAIFKEAHESPELLSQLINLVKYRINSWGFDNGIEVLQDSERHLLIRFIFDAEHKKFRYTFPVCLCFEMWFEEDVVETFIRIGFVLDDEAIEVLGRRLWELIRPRTRND